MLSQWNITHRRARTNQSSIVFTLLLCITYMKFPKIESALTTIVQLARISQPHILEYIYIWYYIKNHVCRLSGYSTHRKRIQPIWMSAAANFVAHATAAHNNTRIAIQRMINQLNRVELRYTPLFRAHFANKCNNNVYRFIYWRVPAIRVCAGNNI